MENKYKYLIKNTGILTIGSFSSKILAFLLVPLYTNVLNTKEYGTYDLITTTIQLLIPIISVNIIEALMRFLLDSENNKKEIWAIGLKYINLSIIIFLILIYINIKCKIWYDLSLYSATVILYYITYIIYQFLIQFGKGIEKVKEIACAGVISTIGIVAFNILFLLIFDFRLYGFFAAYILGQAFASVYLFVSLDCVKYFSIKINKKLEKEMIFYTLPLIFNTLGWWANNVSDRYIVTWLCGISENGIYSVSYKIPVILNTIQTIFVQSWQISAVKEFNNPDSEKFYAKTFTYICMGMTICCSCLILFTKTLASILFANEFYVAWKYVPFLLISNVVNAASGVLGPILTARKNSKALGKSAIYGVIVNTFLNLILVKIIGTQGAAIATLVSSMAIFVSRKKYISSIKYKDNKKIFVSWIVLILQAVLIIKNVSFISQVVLLAFIICIYAYEIRSLINKIRN